MSIVCSDLHCNTDKIKMFLEYKPEEEHVFAGDILDSFNYSFERAMESLKTLVESDCILLWGNHDMHYRKNPPFYCSGFRGYDAADFQEYINKNVKRWQVAYVADNYLITHAGLSDIILDQYTIDPKIQTIVDWLNTEPSEISWIGRDRGGFNKVGGPLWFDFRYEKGLSKKYNQVFGHCCLEEPWEEKTDKYHHVCINTYEGNPELWIFDTYTSSIERINDIDTYDTAA